jgi:hypothetical protein
MGQASFPMHDSTNQTFPLKDCFLTHHAHALAGSAREGHEGTQRAKILMKNLFLSLKSVAKIYHYDKPAQSEMNFETFPPWHQR